MSADHQKGYGRDDAIDDETPWRLALALGMDKDGIVSAGRMRERFRTLCAGMDRTSSPQTRRLARAIAVAHTVLLDFGNAAEYAFMDDHRGFLANLQRNALIHGNADVAERVSKHGAARGYPEMVISPETMQEYLVGHALPQQRLAKLGDESYALDMSRYDRLMRRIHMPEKEALRHALDSLDDAGSDNAARKLILARRLGDTARAKTYEREIARRLAVPREHLDDIMEAHARERDGTATRLQAGDTGKLFPLASSIYRLQTQDEDIVLKERLRLYNDFSRLDGYTQEKEILGRCDHPNIIRYLGERTIGGMGFLALEHATGTTLERYTGEHRLPTREVAAIGASLCGVLEYLHAQGIVYMDLKDKNVMYDREKGAPDGVKLLDFGMSRILPDGTDTGAVVPTLTTTPSYMTPELSWLHATQATDTYQLGLLMHRLLYGTYAFAPDGIPHLDGEEHREHQLIVHSLAASFGEYRQRDDAYGPLLARMLERSPRERPTPAEVRGKLDDILQRDAQYNATGGIHDA